MSDKFEGSDDGEKHVYQRPTGLKGFYYHPKTQIALLGLVCFMCPGLFNALTGLGAGGQIDSRTNSQANVALNCTFAVMGAVAGSFHNKIGSKWTLFIGSLGYSLYIGSYLSINIHPNTGGFVVGAGAVLGICAGLLWTAQGSIMMSYPTEQEKGQFIGIFWAIFNLGAVIGASVALGTNFNSDVGRVGNGTYIGFLVLTCIGFLIPMFMADPKKMIRSDGTRVSIPRHPSWKSEITGLWICLRTDPYVILLFPMFLASNWFYTWQFSGFNGFIFSIRARALNNLVYWLSQIFGSIAIGLLLDTKNLSRRTRAFGGWTVLFAMVWIVHIWAYFYQRTYSRQNPISPLIDIYDHGYVAKVWLYIFMGLLDAMWQTTAYWLMGAMSNDPSKLAYFSGYYKAIQSAGATGIWGADAAKDPLMSIFISTWVLLLAGLLFTLPMIHWRVKNTTELVDETIARMDDSGHIQDVHTVEREIEASNSAPVEEKA